MASGSRECQRQQKQQQQEEEEEHQQCGGIRARAGLASHNSTSRSTHQIGTLGMDRDYTTSSSIDTARRIIPRGAGRGGRRRELSSLSFSPRGRRRLPPPLLLLPLLLLGWCCPVAWAQVQELRILTPLYARPGGDFWTHMVDAAQHTSVSYSVVINPNSGPGDAAEDDYTSGIGDLLDAGIEVLCYVATGFGQTDVSQVTADVDKYESFYPGLCNGFFFDEGPGLEENTWKYTEYYSYVQDSSGPDATVVVNPGIQPHDTMYNIGDAYEAVNPGMGGQVVVVSFENSYVAFGDHARNYLNQEVPFPPRYIPDRYMHSILIYAAYFTSLTEFLDFTVLQLYCENWGYVFFTDDSFGEDGNPWDGTPGYFVSLLDAVSRVVESAGQCGTHAPTHAPTLTPTLSPLALGETRAPLPTPSPTVFHTPQPAGIGQTRAPTIPLPTPAPTPSPTLAPTKAPTPAPTKLPTPAPSLEPSPVPVGEREGSWACRGAASSSSSTLIVAATILVTLLRQQLF